jgi:hypothetical protein
MLLTKDLHKGRAGSILCLVRPDSEHRHHEFTRTTLRESSLKYGVYIYTKEGDGSKYRGGQ